MTASHLVFARSPIPKRPSGEADALSEEAEEAPRRAEGFSLAQQFPMRRSV